MIAQSHNTKTAELNSLTVYTSHPINANNLSSITKQFLNSERAEKNREILVDLLSADFDENKYLCVNPNNTKIIMDAFSIVKQLPPITEVIKHKPEIPVFDPIPVLKTDSAEIKKFIRKVNYDYVRYHCNHQIIEEKCEKVNKNIAQLYESKAYKEYESFISKVIRLILRITTFHNIYDKRQETFYDQSYFISDIDIRTVVDAIIHLNGEIGKINALANKHCSKCEAAVRGHDYCISEIERMREELREQEEIDSAYADTADETRYDIRAFMSKNYPTINRFPLSDVQKKYKATFKINITLSEFEQQIEQTGKFRITNVHRTLYVNRL